MRIVTWNLDHGRCSPTVIEQQQQLLARFPADVTVLTEVPAPMSVLADERVLSPVEREGRLGPEAWVRIAAEGAQPAGPELPFMRMAVAARAVINGEPVVVYGSVLPWLAAVSQVPGLALPGETALELFARVLSDQVADIEALRREHPDHTLIWAGDFNQPLTGPNSGFSNDQRQMLSAALAELGLDAWNKDLGHAIDGCNAIDLICGPADRPAHRVERFEPTVDGAALSDHAGYLVEV